MNLSDFSAIPLSRDLPREDSAISPDLEAETERLLGGRTRDIKLSGPLLALYLSKSWPQRSKIARAWAVWVTLIGLGFMPLSYLLIPQSFLLSAVICLLVVPIAHAGLYWVWSQPRDNLIEGFSALALVAIFMMCFGTLGGAGGGVNAERFATGALFFVSIAIVVFDIGRRWSMAMAACGISIYFGFLMADATVALPSALAVSIYYGMGNIAVVVARQTSTILNQRQFLMSLRDRYRSRALSEANALLEKLATCDPLTGLANRRSAAANFAKIWANPATPKANVAFVMADIDNFKSLNDSAGHAAGDDCIARVARTIESAVRTGDIICRHGGEEFLVVLTGVTPEMAWNFAERIRMGVEAQDIVNPGLMTPGHVTISLGIAFAADDVDPELVIKRVDEALYDAKRAGRNRVMLVDPAGPDSAAPDSRMTSQPLPQPVAMAKVL